MSLIPSHSATAAIAAALLLAACAAGCGGRVVVDEAATAGGDGGGRVEDAGVAGGGTCLDTTPPPSSTQPTTPGCYENDGSGWFKVPCGCELWVKNPTPADATVQFELAMAPGAPDPALNGPLDVEVAFDDPDASWFAVWAKQAGAGEAFAITKDGKKTTVRMATSSVDLAPVALSGCRRRDAKAAVIGGPSATMKVHAVLHDGDGKALTTFDTTCEDIPPVTPQPPG